MPRPGASLRGTWELRPEGVSEERRHEVLEPSDVHCIGGRGLILRHGTSNLQVLLLKLHLLAQGRVGEVEGPGQVPEVHVRRAERHLRHDLHDGRALGREEHVDHLGTVGAHHHGRAAHGLEQDWEGGRLGLQYRDRPAQRLQCCHGLGLVAEGPRAVASREDDDALRLLDAGLLAGRRLQRLPEVAEVAGNEGGAGILRPGAEVEVHPRRAELVRLRQGGLRGQEEGALGDAQVGEDGRHHRLARLEEGQHLACPQLGQEGRNRRKGAQEGVVGTMQAVVSEVHDRLPAVRDRSIRHQSPQALEVHPPLRYLRAHLGRVRAEDVGPGAPLRDDDAVLLACPEVEARILQ
mmetsp:Transcript_88006/g.257265  ORF Transcript_88006/g.257265 Transcript_88006/m.257265 type:complete len:350 (+) Transcript_88006:84-1133(+)